MRGFGPTVRETKDKFPAVESVAQVKDKELMRGVVEKGGNHRLAWLLAGWEAQGQG